MRGGVVGGICLLAFLLSVGRTEELAGVKELEDPQNIQDSRRRGNSKELNDIDSSDDLRRDVGLAATDTISQENEGRSGAMAQSNAYGFGGSSVSNAVALSKGGASSSSTSAYSDNFGSSSQSKASAVAGFSSQAPPLGLFNSELRPYNTMPSNIAQPNARAFSNGGNSYGQRQNSYSFRQSYPYDSESSSAQVQAESDNGYYPPVPIISPNNQGLGVNRASAVANREPYQTIETKLQSDDRLLKSNPVYNPYGQEKSFTQRQPYIDNASYRSAPIASPIPSPYIQGLSNANVQAQADSESSQSDAEPNLPPYRQGESFNNDLYQPEFLQSSVSNSNGQDKRLVQTPDSESQILIEPFSVQSKQRNSDSSSYVYNKASNFPQGLNPTDSESSRPTYYYDNKIRPYDPILNSNGFSSQNEIYQAVPIPNSPYDSFMVPYIEPISTNTQIEKEDRYSVPDYTSYTAPRPYSQVSKSALKYDDRLSSAWDNVPYQAVPFPEPSPFDAFMVPYKEPTQISPESYPKSYESLQKLPNQGWNSASSFTLSTLRGPKLNTDSVKVQNVYKPISAQSRNSVALQPNIPSNSQSTTEVDSTSDERNSTSSDYESSESYNMVRSGPESAQDDADFLENRKSEESNTDQNAYVLDQYPPNDPYPRLYPSGADAVYGDLKVQEGSDAVYPINKKPNPYANDYPVELIPYQSDGYSQSEKLPTSTVFTGGQSSPIAFDDAKSRVISTDEFIFLNKMPGGENFIKCTKENEFHSFWSQDVNCLVCICLNEYGILTPVCASCSGCSTPPAPKKPDTIPRLPEPITVRPASPSPESPEASQPTTEGPNPFPENPSEPIEPKPLPFPSAFPPPFPESIEPKPVPPYPPPIGAPVPLPDPTPETLPTISPPTSTSSCAPLPSGQPFPNPLHPCQICICQEPYLTGKPDVQIQCKDDPQCIAPPDVTTLPPLPDVSVPIPLPMCEKFPEHVLFPHPTETCKLCKCAKHMTETGEAEQHITCYPHPDCVPKLEPITEPPNYTLPPLPFPPNVPIPIEPLREPIEVPLPEIVTVEPLPWPPITSPPIMSTSVPTPPLTPRPGPLPGPSPHESCRPYPPNQTFQHPWDECQICQCTESSAVGVINVEVNCYTKPSCCIEPPDASNPGYPKPSYAALSNNVDENQIVPVSASASASSSTFRPLAAYPARPPIYPGSSQPSADGLGSAFPSYSRLKPDEQFSNQASSYPYQPNYHPGYGKPQYPEYPARLPVPNSPGYSQSNYGYPGNYQYRDQGDAYPGPQGSYQSYDPRYPGLPAPNVYPPVYSRPNYDMPSMYPAATIRDGYPQPAASTQGGTGLTAAQAFARDQLLRSKTDKSEDAEET